MEAGFTGKDSRIGKADKIQVSYLSCIDVNKEFGRIYSCMNLKAPMNKIVHSKIEINTKPPSNRGNVIQ